DPNSHDAHIRSCCLRAGKPLQPANFEMFVEMLRQVHGKHVLRLKGIVALADDPARPIVVHGVQHVFHPPVRLESWPDTDRTTRVVCILHDLDPSHVEGLWNAFNGGIALDTPDAAALSGNPLNPGRGGLLG
ncbi:MAG: GTP-binding protein, partial [Beijerinckiaceae bacterium]